MQKWCCYERRRHASVERILWISNSPTSSAKFESLNFYLFFLCVGFHYSALEIFIFSSKKKKRIDIEGRRRRNVNSCSKSSTFRCSLFFSSSKKVLAERIRDGGIHYNIFKEGWKCLWGSFLCSRAEFTASRSNDNGVCIFMIECWQARVIGWCQQHQLAFHKVNQSDFNEIFISIVTHDFCRLRI